MKYLSLKKLKAIKKTSSKINNYYYGDFKNESNILSILMHTTGVYKIENKKDLWILAYRTHIIYGNKISTDLLLLNEVFFQMYEAKEPNEKMDIGDFLLESYRSGIKRTLLTSDLNHLIGFKYRKKKNVRNKKFLKKKIVRASNFWTLDDGIFLFPGTHRNYRLRKRLLKGKKIKRETIESAKIWADLAVKHI